MATHPDRYYVYTPTMGRKRVPAAHETSEWKAMQYAKSTGSDNLVREEGPRSNITATTLVWERHPRHAGGLKVVFDVDGIAYTVDPAALTPVKASA